MPWWWPFGERSKQRIAVARVLEEVKSIIDHIKTKDEEEDVGEFRKYAEVAHGKIKNIHDSIETDGATFDLDQKEREIMKSLFYGTEDLVRYSERYYWERELIQNVIIGIEEDIRDLLKRL